jgi:apoptosis-inducing factor 3
MSDDQNETLPDLTKGIEIQRIPEGGISAGYVGKERIFLWRNGNSLKAYSANCPHLGGPLDKGILANGIVRCPWHHACFDLASGEATAAPAFDALPEYSVVLSGSRASVKSACAQKVMNTSQREASQGTMAIVGGEPPGLPQRMRFGSEDGGAR